MQLHVFNYLDQYKHGSVYREFLGLRKRVLVDGLGWQIPHNSEVEEDQYDNPTAVYSVVRANGAVIAGARAAPCNSQWGEWSYMLKDARDGKIDAIPKDLLQTYPESASTWECTRFVSANTGFARQSSWAAEQMETATKLVVAGLCEFAFDQGAEHLMSLSPLGLGRLLRSFGYQAKTAGGGYRCREDGRRYRPFFMTCDKHVNRALFQRHLAADQTQWELRYPAENLHWHPQKQHPPLHSGNQQHG